MKTSTSITTSSTRGWKRPPAHLLSTLTLAAGLLITPHALGDAKAIVSGKKNWSVNVNTSINGKNPCGSFLSTTIGTDLSVHCASTRGLFPRGTADATASVTGGVAYHNATTTGKGKAGSDEDPFGEEFYSASQGANCELSIEHHFGAGHCNLEIDLSRDDSGRFEIALIDTRGMSWADIQAIYTNDTSVGVAIANGHVPEFRVIAYLRERDFTVAEGHVSLKIPTNGLGESDVTILSMADSRSNTCGVDFDDSGFADLDDFTAFIAAFEEGNDNADFDGSGFVDTDDFTEFVLAFEAGC